MTKVFIDGEAGTTGLRIHDRLAAREDIELLHIPDELRKDPATRQQFLTEADIAFLCLPDAASREAVELAGDASTVLIDTSTAYRTADDWTYGFPEINGLRDKIATSKRIANPGCHASGFISLVAPLMSAGILANDVRLSATSISGYSGAGKKTIAVYEDGAVIDAGSGADGAASDAVLPADALLRAPRLYALTQQHKHLPEMVKVCGLSTTPVFLPIIAPYYAGMEVIVSLFAEDLQEGKGIDDVRAALADAYASTSGEGLVRFVENADEDGFLSALAFTGRDDMQVTVTGNDERIVLISRFDNLGKGASGAAIQNMNIVLGVDETTGLVI